MTIPCAEFIGRFLLHVLPKGFQKIRAYGFLAPRAKKAAANRPDGNKAHGAFKPHSRHPTAAPFNTFYPLCG